ncbi:hypothetical protein [Streptomyces sp. NPDC056361]|uniref:hypothetical protein n=1 Tax=Streptomyces sp. NPDC056361 TaxID=3345795 RepID=UPI0035DEC806
MRSLLQDDSNYRVRDQAFCLAVRSYCGHIAQLLLQYGADPSQCTSDELLPLREAVESGSPTLVEALLDHIKKIKRQLYGRAGFPLLRKMILLQ